MWLFTALRPFRKRSARGGPRRLPSTLIRKLLWLLTWGKRWTFHTLVTSEHGEFFVGKGPGIPKGANTNPEVFRLLTQAADSNGIPYQVSATPSTSPTDARILQINRSGTAAGLLEVPLRYMHTPSEVISLIDVEDCARLMAAFCRMVTPQTDFKPLR
jgi:putative aminopeptidase FrvX